MSSPPIGCQPSDESRESAHKRVALVTGSAPGIGAIIAVDLASANYRLIVTGRNSCRLAQVVQQCNHVSGSTQAAVAFPADLYDLSQVDRLIEFVRITFNRLDVLVNNACYRGDVADILDDRALDELGKVFHVNVSVPMYLIHKCLLPLKPAGMATVINISSSASQVVVPLHLYSISKACLSELTRQLATLTQELGILSVTISPGPVLTDERPHHSAMSSLTLMNRVGTTQEISNLVMFAISNAHLFNGQELNIDGGYTVKQKQPDSGKKMNNTKKREEG